MQSRNLEMDYHPDMNLNLFQIDNLQAALVQTFS